MKDLDTWILLATADGAAGLAVGLSAHVGEGPHGDAVRRLELPDACDSLQECAVIGTKLAYNVLRRERYIDRQVVVRYELDCPLDNVRGRSADLAFALAFAVAATPGNSERKDLAFAATGILGVDGVVLPVEDVPEKLAAALEVLPERSLFIYPGGNEDQLTTDMRRKAEVRQITLVPSFRLEQALQEIGFAISHTWLECPFRGLEPFEFSHASIFFGRAQEIEEVLTLLARRIGKDPIAALVQGPSGSGKSSLVLAGVIPALLRRGVPGHPGKDVRWGLLRPRAATPDTDPARELANLGLAMRASWCHGEEGGLSADHLEAAASNALDAGAFVSWLHGQATTPKLTNYVWVLDQMEEWLQGPLQPATIRSLCLFLAEVARRGVWLIGTITSAGATLLRDHDELAAVFAIESQYLIAPQHKAANLDAVIREPARAAGLRFEPGLETEIFAAASHGGTDVLPLLELLLTELYERRDPVRNELRFEDYRSAGGLNGVIGARAEAVYAQASPAQQMAVSQMLWKLATTGELLLSDYGTDHAVRGLAALFQARRLLVEDRNSRGEVGLRAAHEALFRHWPRAIEHRRQNEADIRLWLDLQREAGQWARAERALIPPGPQLTAAQSLCRRRRTLWTAGDQSVVDYVERSTVQQGRRQMLTRIAIGIPTLLATAAGIVAIYDYVESRYVTRLTFDEVAMGASGAVAADAYLHHNGISVSTRTPQESTLVIRSGASFYNGRALDSVVRPNVLTQTTAGDTAPMSYTLTFAQPLKSLTLRRAALWPATRRDGVSHPAWNARAFDDAGSDVAAVGEPLLRAHDDVAARAFVLKGTGGTLIRSVRITSDFRNEKGEPFAGFQAVLISEIDLGR